MAQLSNDCFKAGDALMPVEEALDMLRGRIKAVADVETVPLKQALGRVLAADVVAPRNVPPHDNSAVDGYGVRHADLSGDGETRLPVVARIAAGHPLGRTVQAGEAVRIFTGAPAPDGVDTIFMEEDAVEADGHVTLPSGLKKGANYRLAGEDVRDGSVILTAGTRLRPQEVGLAASVGCAELSVRKALRVAVFSTGDEVRDPGSEIGPGLIYDANRYTVMDLLKGLGCAVTDLGILPDDFDTIADALDGAAGDHDMLITSGGVSLGEEDHVKAAVEKNGALHFWRLAIKPGRPIALGQVGNTAFVGLPGNPVATMVTFMLIARPLVLLLGGAVRDLAPPRYPLVAGFDAKKKAGRREWLRAHLVTNAEGTTEVMTFPSTGAGILTSMVKSSGLVELSESCEGVERGDMVAYLPFKEVV